MNILLVNLYYGPQEQPLVTLAKAKVINPPLGLLQLATIVKQNDHNVIVIDEQCEEDLTKEKYVKIIKKNSIDIVGFSVNTLNYNYFVKLSEYIKNNIDCTIVAGGVHITALREKALHQYVDYLFIGESDESFTNFVDSLSRNDLQKIESLPGVIFNKNGKIINNGRTLIKNIDRLPFADRTLLDYKKYFTTLPTGQKVFSTGISAARGCPYKCVFCAEQILTGNFYRFHNLEYVIEEMMFVYEKYGITHINFYDSTFNVRRDNVIKLCNLIINLKQKFTFWIGARASLLDLEMLKLLKAAGLVRLGIAIESGNNEILKLIKKNQTTDDLVKAFEMAHKLNIPTEATAMIGNPGDTLKTMFQTANFIRKINTISITTLGIAIPYPGTELHEMAKQNKYGLRLLSEDWDKYHIYGLGVMEVNGFSPKQLVFLQKILLIWSYLQINKIISVIREHDFISIFKSFLVFLFKPRK